MCNSSWQEHKKIFCWNIAERISKSTTFWKTIRPFLNNKDDLNNEPLSLSENGELVTRNDRIAKIFNEYYINILKETTGNEPSSLPRIVESDNDLLDIYYITEKDNDRLSVTSIKESSEENVKFEFKPATEADIFHRLLSWNPQKPGGYDKIPPKLVSLSADVLAKPFIHVVNSGIHSHTFPDSAKVAVVTPVFKKDDRRNKQNLGQWVSWTHSQRFLKNIYSHILRANLIPICLGI